MPIRYGSSSDDDLDLGSGSWIAYGLDGDDRIRTYGEQGNSGFPFFAPVWHYSGDDRLYGMDGNDVIGSGEGADELYGGNDNDILDGSIGSDELYGENGDDILILAYGNDTYDGGGGYDILDASLINQLAAFSQFMEISSNPGADDERPIIVDATGVELNLRTGRAYLREADGTRSELMGVSSFRNFEEVLLTSFGDWLADDGASHTVVAGAGNDIVYSGEGDDVAFGGDGDDRLNGEPGNDLLFGDSGNDDLDGGDGFDRLEGGEGADLLLGGNANDELEGGAGGDVLDGEGGVDTADYQLSNAAVSVVLLDLGTGGTGSGGIAEGDRLFRIENVIGSRFSDTLIGDGGVNTLDGRDGNDTLIGGGGRDTLIGGAGADTLSGGAENDSLNSGDGNDTLNGGSGADYMSGGDGNDTYTVDDAGDLTVELSGAGTDTVKASVSYTLQNNVSIEILQTTTSVGATPINLTGNNLANRVIGNAGSNVLSGLGNDDRLEGLGENDSLFGGDGNDILLGGDGNDGFLGGNGNDTLTGGSGGDTFVFDSALNALTNVDTITDYKVADDTIALVSTVFTGLATGALSATHFTTSFASQDANDFIIYDSASGDLFYDADGAGGAAAIRFAQLSAELGVSAADFFVV